MPKYTVIINGKERTIDKDKFDGNVDVISARYPDAKIKAINGNEEGMLPISNYSKAIERGYRMVEMNDVEPVSTPVVDSSHVQQRDSVKDYKPIIQAKETDTSTDNEHKEQERKSIEEQVRLSKDKNEKEYLTAQENKKKADYEAVVDNPFAFISEILLGTQTKKQVEAQKKAELSRASLEKANDALNMVEEANKKGNTTFVSGFGRGFWEKISKASTLDFGATDFKTNLDVLSAAKKYEAGQSLSNEEEALLDAIALEAAASGEFAEDLGRGYKAGQTTAESLPFMAEFMINPATGTGKAVSKAAAKRIITNFGKEAAKSTIGKIARNSVRVAGDIAGAGIMAGTTGAMRTTADAIDRATGEVNTIIDEDGYYRFGGTDEGDDIGKSLAKAYTASTIENFSEMFGNYLSPIGTAIGSAGRKVMNKIGLKKVNEIIGDIKSSDVAKVIDDFQAKTQWNGTIGEYLEEQAGMVMNALTVGDNNLSDIVDVDTQIDTFLGVSSLGGLFSGIKTFGYAKKKYSAKKKLNEADHLAANNSVIDEQDWDDLKEKINQADDSELVSILSETLGNDNISDEGKQAVLLYAGRLKAYHGASLADLKRKTEGDTPDEIVQSQINFDEGYKLAEADRSEKRRALRDMNELERKLDDEFLYAADDDRYKLVRQRADAGEDVSDELTYINSQSRFDGMILGIRDAIDEKVSKSNQYITNLTHQDGNIYDVTLATDEKKHMFVINGSIVADENGIIDKKQSDSRFIVRDDTGKVAMRSVDDLYKLEASNNAEALKEVTAQTIREQESARYAEEIETPSEDETAKEVALIQPGDVISLNMQGIVTTAIVQSKRDGSTILQFEEPIEYNGKKSHAIELSDEQVQSMIIPEAENTDALVDTNVENNGLPLEEQSNLLNNEEAIITNEVPVAPAIENTPINVESVGDLPVQEQMTVSPVEVDGVQGNQTVAIPVDKKGNKIYHKVPVDVSLEDMRTYGLDDVETDEFVNSQKIEAAKRFEKLQKGKPKVGTNLEKYQMDKKAWTDEMADAQAQTDYWNEVEAQLQAIRERPGDITAKEIKSLGEPMNGGELAAAMLGNGNLPLLYGDYKRETGFSNTDARGMFGMFASKENGGMTIEQAGEQLMLADLENGTNFFDQNDPNAGRNAILDVLSSARTRGGLIDYIKNNREVMAERERQAELEADERAKEQWFHDNLHMTPEEYELWDQGELFTESNMISDEDYQEFMSNFADKILNEQENDRRTSQASRSSIAESESNEQGGISGVRESGGPVLQGEESVSAGTTGRVEEESGQVDANSSSEHDALQSSTSGGELDSSSRNLESVPGSILPRMEGEPLLDYASRVKDAYVLHEEEQKVNLNPTEAQKEAGNYKKGHIKVDGFDITIEDPRGSERSGVDADGKSWSVTMNNTYGYIRGTESVDGDHIDLFLGDSGNGVYVVDQVKEDGSFDEHKVMYGFGSIDEAKNAYLSNYSSGWNGLGNIMEVSKEDFKKWIQSSKKKTKPFAEYSSVKPVNVEDAEDDKTYLKAPNGKPTNLNKKQWEQVRTKAFKDWFGDWENEPENSSKVVDENGEPLVVYHGTSTGGFSIFNTYGSNFGLFGQGSYFTDTREVAESYMDKGNGDSKQVYGVFLNIRRPLDMNSHNIAEGWKEALPDEVNVEIGEDSTNESVYKSVLESFVYNEYPKSEAQEILYDLPVTLGYDGVTHIGGGRYNKKSDTRHQVWIAMEPTQIKSATDNMGEFSGENGDIRFREVFHGSPHDFDQFNHSFMSTGEGVQVFGWGTYVTEVNGIAKGYAETLASRSQTKRINELARSVSTKKDFIKTRKQDIKRNDDYDKYARAIKKNLKGLYAELKNAKKDENEKDERFYQSLIEMAEGQLDHDYYNNLLDSFWDDINYTQKEIDEMEKEIADLNRQIKNLKGKRHLYTVEIPDSDGMNYLKWNEPLTVIQKNMIAEQAEKEGYGDYQISYRDEHGNLVLNTSGDVTGGSLYEELSKEFLFGSDKTTSEFLNRAGFVGIEYPAEAMSGGREDNAKNFVIFDDKDLAVEEHVRFRNEGEGTIRTYHGSGVEFDKFDLAHSGEGKGESMIGKGVYTTKDKQIAKNYADAASNREIGGRKHIYEVEIPTDNGKNYLDYDKVYDTEEMSEIAERLRSVGVDVDFGRYFNSGKANGKNLYMVMDWSMPDGMNVNQALSDAGYVGYKYSTRHDLGGKEKRFPKKSYVVFDEGNTAISDHEQVASEIEKISGILHTPVKMVRSLDELPDGMARRAIENGRNVKGWFDTKNDEVVVYLPNVTGEEDAKATFLHEVVGHKGLRALLGEKSYDDEMVRLYGLLPVEQRGIVTSTAVHDYGGNVAIAMDEYLAEQAEKDETPSWWNKVVSAIRDLLRKKGIDVKLSNNDVKYLLWRSRKKLESSNIHSQAEDVVMRKELGIGKHANGGNIDINEYLEQEISLFNNAYNSKQNTILRGSMTDEQLREAGIDDEHVDVVREILNDGKTLAGFVPSLNKILIFADNISESYLSKIESTLFHENLHGILNDMYGEENRNIAQTFYDSAKDHYKKLDSFLRSNYDIDEVPEEFFVYMLENDMSEGNFDRYSKFFKNEELETLNLILKNIGYDKQREERRRTDNSTNPGKREMWNGSSSGINEKKENKEVLRTERGGKGDVSKEGEQIDLFSLAEQIAKDDERNRREIRFRVGEEAGGQQQGNEGIAQSWYENALDKAKNKMYRWQEAYQDSMLGLKRMQEAIEKEIGAKLKHFEDAYMAENQMSSRSAFETEVYKDKFLIPMLNAIKAITDKGVNRDDVNAYVMAKHGLERNKVFAWRDAIRLIEENDGKDAADKLQKEHDNLISALKGKLNSGEIGNEEYEKQEFAIRSSLIPEYAENRLRDYSGLTQLTGEEGYEKAAKELVDSFEYSHTDLCDTLWQKINLATRNSLKKSYESGLMTRGIYEKMESMFDYYVPLRGFSDDVASDVYDYILSENSPFNAPIQAAKGRKSQADDPFATIGNMAESGILQGNRNLMKQKFLNMVLNHPTSLATVKTMWYENAGTSDNAVWEQSFPFIEKDATPDEIAQAIDDHEKRMIELEKNGMAKKSNKMINLAYRASKREKSEHTVVVKSGGKEYVIYVNGNPRAAQAINGLTNPDAMDHKFMQMIGKLNRQLAANFTTRNPAFVLSNASRDIIFSTSAIWIKEDWKYAKRFDKNVIKNIKAIVGLMARYKSGKLDIRNSRDRYFLEFLENGGETGYTALHNVEEYKKMMDRHIKKSNGAVGSVSSGIHAIIDAISFMNRCAENVSRFTTYQTSREMGRGISESVRDAKEVTVNFNKKGAGGLGAGTFKSLFLFFNAAVQSLNNFKGLHDKSKSKFYTSIGGFATAGILVPMINNAIIEMLVGDGDDDMTDEERVEWMKKKDAYDNLPEWVRRNNFCIWVGGDRFITIPLPIELRAFYGLGDMWYQMGKGNMNGIDGKVDVKKASLDMVNQLTELLPINPLGGNGDGLSVLVPDAGKPLYQAFTNRDFFGKPIYKKNDYNELMPAWTKAFNGTAKWMVNSAEFLNELSGDGDKYKRGDIDVNPATIEHLFEGYFGGMGKTANQLYKTISMIWDEDERMWRNVPVANRFISGSDNKIEFRKVNEVYYQCIDELKETEQRLRGYENEAEMGIEEYAEKYNFLNESKENERYLVMKEYKSIIDDIYKSIKESDPDEKKEMEMEANLLKMEMIDVLSKIK